MTWSIPADGTLVYGMVGVPPTMDPHDQVLPTDFAIRLCFDSLLVPDGSGGLAPRLARSYRLVDPLTWEFELEPDACFASGRRVTAEAVKWSFDRLARNKTFAASSRLSTYDGAEVVSASTIRFRTRQPDMVWPRRAVQVVVADPQTADADGGFGACPGQDSGSGPYRIVAFSADGFVRVERSPRSWRGQAKIPALEMTPYDPQALNAAFLAGEAHLGYSTEDVVDALVAAGLVLQRQAQANVHTLRFNSLSPPFDDIRLRHAIALAVDQTRIVAEVYNGHGAPANQVVGADCFGYDPDLPPLRSDMDEARALVDAAGFTGTLTFDILAASAVLRPWCERVMADLNAVGIRTEPVYVTMREYLGKMTANNPPKSDLIGAGNQYGPGLDADFGLDKSSNKLPPIKVEYSNAEYQALYDASLAEVDVERRRALLQRCARILMDDVASVPIWQPSLGWLVSPKLSGLRMNSLGAGWADWLCVDWT